MNTIRAVPLRLAIALGLFVSAWTLQADLLTNLNYQLFWQERTDVGSPGPRYGHALAYDSDRGITVFFGGEYSEVGGDPEYFNDTWEYDGASWKKIIIDGAIPDPRSRHAMCYDNTLHQVILFGGFGNGNFMNDVWDYESTGAQRGRWIHRSAATGPSPRFAHTMVFDFFQGIAIVAGGTPDSGYDQTPEVWEWNNGSGQWFYNSEGVGYSAGQKLGAGLTDHEMLYDYRRHETVLIGGIGPFGLNGQHLNDKIWFPTSSQGPLKCGPHVTQAAIVYDGFHDLYLQFGGNWYNFPYDYTPADANPGFSEITYRGATTYPCGYKPSEITVTLADSLHPGARAQCAMVYDEKRRTTVLYGGVGGTRYGDTWELVTRDLRDTWADFKYQGREVGTIALPFKTLARALDNTAAAGIVTMKAGSTSEAFSITNAVTLHAFGGPVTIGRR